MIEVSTTEKGDKTRTHSAQSFLFCRHCSHVKHFLRADLLLEERGEIQFLEVFLLNVAVLPSWTLKSFLSDVIFLFNCIQLLLKLWLSYLFLSFLQFLAPLGALGGVTVCDTSVPSVPSRDSFECSEQFHVAEPTSTKSSLTRPD